MVKRTFLEPRSGLPGPAATLLGNCRALWVKSFSSGRARWSLSQRRVCCWNKENITMDTLLLMSRLSGSLFARRGLRLPFQTM